MKKEENNEEYLNFLSKDPLNWKGPFYFNKRDPRYVIPADNPSSRNIVFNWAKPHPYIFFVGIVVLLYIGLQYSK
jgi:uncharacterized membrane protein